MSWLFKDLKHIPSQKRSMENIVTCFAIGCIITVLYNLTACIVCCLQV